MLLISLVGLWLAIWPINRMPGRSYTCHTRGKALTSIAVADEELARTSREEYPSALRLASLSNASTLVEDSSNTGESSVTDPSAYSIRGAQHDPLHNMSEPDPSGASPNSDKSHGTVAVDQPKQDSISLTGVNYSRVRAKGATNGD